MPSGPVRRAQMIAPFGVGALFVSPNGSSLISGGLDHWYEREGPNQGQIDPGEFEFEEWRLQRLLRVNHLRLPPDYRTRSQSGDEANLKLTVPFLRFPQWHFCSSCGRLYEWPLTARRPPDCEPCKKQRRPYRVYQVRFIAMCDHGHIQDFPWREWVHRSVNPSCRGQLKLQATGGASLAGEKVVCECQKERTLSGIMGTDSDGESGSLSRLVTAPNGTEEYLCRGLRPWLGTDEPSDCGRSLRGTLRNAANVYFAQVRSAIYLPRGHNREMRTLIEKLSSPPLSTFINAARGMGLEFGPANLRQGYGRELQGYTDGQLQNALRIIQQGTVSGQDGMERDSDDDDEELRFRRDEYEALCHPRDDDQLLIRPETVTEEHPIMAGYLCAPMLVYKLRETRALAGFTRIYPENDQTPEERRAMLWREPPVGDHSWLPAYTVYGEGIFIRLQEERLKEWEARADVRTRVQPLLRRYQELQSSRHLRPRPLKPRLVLLHTFAHLLINRLTFECGYSSSALRERLYVSVDEAAPMAGILIYTAAGDSEGTMGGLVRIGKPAQLELVIRRALEEATWCSTDPVCMEIGKQGGQGPDSCNLAACHNCALVPETACEEFNRFLDRAVVIGEPETRMPGYFAGFAG